MASDPNRKASHIPLDYQDGYPPELFDETEGYAEEDTSFYRRLADRFPGKILELGCGTGKHVLRLAKMGYECWGLDIVPQFIDYARRKWESQGDRKGKATFVVGDMVNFDILERFSVIFVTCGSLYQIITSENRVSLARCASAHLLSGGVLCLASEFFFDKAGRFPIHSDGFHRIQELKRSFHCSGDEYETQQTRLYNPITQMIEGKKTIINRSNPLEKHRRHKILAHVSTPDELELILLSAGLKIIDRYGHSDGRPLDTSKVDQGWTLIVGQLPK